MIVLKHFLLREILMLEIVVRLQRCVKIRPTLQPVIFPNAPL